MKAKSIWSNLLLSIVALATAQASQAGRLSPYLPAQGKLVATQDCRGFSIRPGDSVTVTANKKGVEIKAGNQKLALDRVYGDFGALLGTADLSKPSQSFSVIRSQPDEIDGQLVFNGYEQAPWTGGIASDGILVSSGQSLANISIASVENKILIQSGVINGDGLAYCILSK